MTHFNNIFNPSEKDKENPPAQTRLLRGAPETVSKEVEFEALETTNRQDEQIYEAKIDKCREKLLHATVKFRSVLLETDRFHRK